MAGALDRAKARCQEKGIKWTALRERVFLHVTASHRPIGAYELIESLAGEGKRLTPVSVYRILEVLQSAGVVHRLESRNAFYACMSAHEAGLRTVSLICGECDCVTEAEAPEAFQAIGEAAGALNFKPRDMLIEVTGTCGACAERRSC
jgi:Fur family zinc uptake transcriptional regulator